MRWSPGCAAGRHFAWPRMDRVKFPVGSWRTVSPNAGLRSSIPSMRVCCVTRSRNACRTSPLRPDRCLSPSFHRIPRLRSHRSLRPGRRGIRRARLMAHGLMGLEVVRCCSWKRRPQASIRTASNERSRSSIRRSAASARIRHSACRSRGPALLGTDERAHAKGNSLARNRRHDWAGDFAGRLLPAMASACARAASASHGSARRPAAVGFAYGEVHGITLAFGFTLIGVAQDYPIHFFSHQRRGLKPLLNVQQLWPTLATGVAATCVAYLAFLASGVTGLAQLGVFSIAGLLVAGLATRCLLPRVSGDDFRDPALRGRSPALKSCSRFLEYRRRSTPPSGRPVRSCCSSRPGMGERSRGADARADRVAGPRCRVAGGDRRTRRPISRGRDNEFPGDGTSGTRKADARARVPDRGRSHCGIRTRRAVSAVSPAAARAPGTASRSKRVGNCACGGDAGPAIPRRYLQAGSSPTSPERVNHRR